MLLLRTELPTHTILYFMMMNKTEIFRKIGGILAELNEQYEYIAENPENFNELELELFLANADFLSEHTKILMKLVIAKPEKTTPNRPVAEEKNVNTEPSQQAQVISQYIPEKPVEASPVDEPEAQDKEVVELPAEVAPGTYPYMKEIIVTPPPPVTDNSIPQEGELIKPQDKPAPEVLNVPEIKQMPEAEPAREFKPVYEPQSVPDTKPAQEPVQPVAKPDAPVPTLNDLISGQQNKQPSVGGLYTHKPVSDLKSIINLNDKLLFIKDLFNGYSLAYSEAIEILNRFDSFEAAEHFLQSNYAVKNNWASKQSSADKLYELLHRRFS